jgi:hypothetical protein
MGIKFANNAASVLASGITNVATSITITTGEGVKFPAISGNDFFYCTLANLAGTAEVVLVTSRTGDVFTVLRGQDNTTAIAWNLGDKFELRLVTKVLYDLYNRAATGGGTDAAFYENDAVVTTNYTIGQGAYVSGVTMTMATPAVFTLANHGFVQDSQVHLSTTGALYTGLTVDTPYYVIAAGLTSSTFQLSATSNGTAINTSGTQSGVHSVGKIRNAVVAGPFTIATGVTITIPTGARLSIV